MDSDLQHRHVHGHSADGASLALAGGGDGIDARYGGIRILAESEADGVSVADPIPKDGDGASVLDVDHRGIDRYCEWKHLQLYAGNVGEIGVLVLVRRTS